MPAQIRFVSAGAGSGKTFALTKILSEELAAKRARPAGVIATTFTRKAAAELRERVRSHLIGEGEYQMANAMGQARIGTVNGVCGGLLERFAFEAGLPTELRVLDEMRAKRLLGEAIDVAVESRQLTELLEVARRMGLEDDGSRFGGDSWRDAPPLVQPRPDALQVPQQRRVAAPAELRAKCLQADPPAFLLQLGNRGTNLVFGNTLHGHTCPPMAWIGTHRSTTRARRSRHV